MANNNNVAEAKKKLNALIEKINKNSPGEEKVIGFASDPDIMKKLTIERISLPSMRLNDLTGGGIPKGRMTMIMGDSDSGKTACMLETIGMHMKEDPSFMALWLESESSLEQEAMTEMFGIDPERFVYIEIEKSKAAEGALDKLLALIDAHSFDIAVVNSVKCLTPSKEYDDSMSDQNIGLQARMMSKLTRKITAPISKQNTALVLINHKTTDIGVMYGNNLVSAAGRALRYASLIILDFSSKSILDSDPVSKDTHKKIGVKSVKNHCSQRQNPYGKTEYFVEYGVGTDINVELIDVLVKNEIIKKAGAWFSVLDENTGDPVKIGEHTLKWQGKEKLAAAISNISEIKDYLMSRAKGETISLTETLSDEEIDEIKEIEELEKEMSKAIESVEDADKPTLKKTKKKAAK